MRTLTLSGYQRVRLYLLNSTNGMPEAQLRELWKLADKFAFSEEEKKIVNYRWMYQGTEKGIQFEREAVDLLPSAEVSLEASELALLVALLKRPFNAHDREWLEPLWQQLADTGGAA